MYCCIKESLLGIFFSSCGLPSHTKTSIMLASRLPILRLKNTACFSKKFFTSFMRFRDVVVSDSLNKNSIAFEQKLKSNVIYQSLSFKSWKGVLMFQSFWKAKIHLSLWPTLKGICLGGCLKATWYLYFLPLWQQPPSDQFLDSLWS